MRRPWKSSGHRRQENTNGERPHDTSGDDDQHRRRCRRDALVARRRWADCSDHPAPLGRKRRGGARFEPDANPPPPGEPGKDYNPVITPNGTTLPYKLVAGVKVMHLIVEEVDHEFAPGLCARCWGYNGQVHGPTIEAVEGDRVRIYVTNRLSAATTVHWHALILPSAMDGVGGLSQRADSAGGNVQVRVHASPARHVHVPQPSRRDDPDVDGAARDVHHPPPQCSRGATAGSRLRSAPERMENRARHVSARSERDDRFQRAHVQRPRVSRHRAARCQTG